MNVFLVLCIVTRRNDLVDENLTADVDDGRRRDLIISSCRVSVSVSIDIVCGWIIFQYFVRYKTPPHTGIWRAARLEARQKWC